MKFMEALDNLAKWEVQLDGWIAARGDAEAAAVLPRRNEARDTARTAYSTTFASAPALDVIARFWVEGAHPNGIGDFTNFAITIDSSDVTCITVVGVATNSTAPNSWFEWRHMPLLLQQVFRAAALSGQTMGIAEAAGSAGERKSCVTCPSFGVDERNLVEMCTRFDLPIGTSSLRTSAPEATAVARSLAERCPWHGKPVDASGGMGAPTMPADRWVSDETMEDGFTIALPLAVDERSPALPGPASCWGCKGRIEPDQMMEFAGWPRLGCAVRGRFIPDGRASSIAKTCRIGLAGDPAPMDLGESIFVLRPDYFALDIEGIRTEGTVESVAFVDPSEYPTDAPVSDEDVAAGVRAWRRLDDPSGAGNSILMPIFDRDLFLEEQRVKIPTTGDDGHPELYVDHLNLLYRAVVLWLGLGETPALNGPAGVGKTDFFRFVAWSMQLPFDRFSITSSTELDDLAGKMLFEDGETRFHRGRLPQAWERAGVIVIDEPNTGRPEVWQFLRPLTDDSKQLVLDMNKGERIERHRFAFMGMAFNPSWDVRNSGTFEISDADGSRLMHIAVPMPDADTERRIIRDRCLRDGYEIPSATLGTMIKVAADLRAAAEAETFPMHWGIRQQIKVGRLTRWFPLPECYRLAAGDLLDPPSREMLEVMVKTNG